MVMPLKKGSLLASWPAIPLVIAVGLEVTGMKSISERAHAAVTVGKKKGEGDPTWTLDSRHVAKGVLKV